MKKNYMTPSVKVAMIKAPTILAGSVGEGDNPIVKGTIEDATGIAAKGADFEDIDDDGE